MIKKRIMLTEMPEVEWNRYMRSHNSGNIHVGQTLEKLFARSDFKIRYSAFLEEKKNFPLHLISPIALKMFVFCCIPRHSPVFHKSSKKSSSFEQKISIVDVTLLSL